VIASLVVVYFLARGTPDWYQPQLMTADERDAAAQRATNKLVEVQNQAALARAEEHQGRSQPPSMTGSPTDPITISFTDQEINAFFQKWSVWESVRASYEKYFTDPYIVIQNGQLILAGKLKELNAIASLEFEPRIDARGQLDLKLAHVLVGKLPLPQRLFAQYQDRATAGLEARLPMWRKYANIDSTGVANGNAISASMGQLLVNVLREQSSEPLLFLPMIEHGCLPVRVSDVKIEDHTLMLIVHPMTFDERAELLQRIRSGQTTEAGAQ
jgi:hypothetical protein